MKTVEKVKAAFIRSFESGSNRVLNNKVELNPRLLQDILDLILKNRKIKVDTAQLIFLINSLATPPKKTYKLDTIIRTLVQIVAEGGMLLTLLGYAAESSKTVAGLDGRGERSVLSLILSLGIVTPAFLGLYMLIIWDAYGKIYNGTLGVPIQFVCQQWQNSQTWGEFFGGVTWDAGKSLYNNLRHYFTRVSETWQHRDSFFDFLSQQGGIASMLLLVPLIMLGIGSAASVLELNWENLDEWSVTITQWINDVFPGLIEGEAKFLFNTSVWPAVLTATPVNAYSVFPVLSAVWNRLMRLGARTNNEKAERMFADFQKFNLALLNKTDAAMIVQILFDIIKRVEDPRVAEKIISGFFAGQTAKDVFDKGFLVDQAGSEARSGLYVNKEEAEEAEVLGGEAECLEGITVERSVSDKKYPFCASVNKLYHQLGNLGFFQKPPVEPEKQSKYAPNAYQNV